MSNTRHPPEAPTGSHMHSRRTRWLALALVLGLIGFAFVRHFYPMPVPVESVPVESGELASAVLSPLPDKTPAAKLLEERNRLNETVWKKEVLAQEYEQVFVNLWDALRAADDKLTVVEGFAFTQLKLGQAQARKRHDLDITEIPHKGVGRTLDPQAWRSLLAEVRAAGYEIVETEWHHGKFDPAGAQAARSIVNMTAHILNRKTNTRLIIKGALRVEWEPRPDSHQLPRASILDATSLRIIARTGDPAFRLAYEIKPPTDKAGKPGSMTPLVLLYDLNRDGLSEIIVPSLNEIHVNRGDWAFDRLPLCKFPQREEILSGVLADFTGDGLPDFACAGYGPLLLYEADAVGRFSTPPRQVCADGITFESPSVFTAGDLDADGDLDLWVGQYKTPYVAGQMPTPYYDANDGFPSYFFQNNGQGEFTDVTERVGLSGKRFRRTYSASAIDLDDDLDLDLVVCSDFAGLDVYLNDGQGRFTDVTETYVDFRHSFGMSLSFADYNRDGNIDMFMTGMGSTTARRLEQMGLGRDEFPLHQQMRMPMAYGNRMYLATAPLREASTTVERRFQQASFNDQVARTGWSWGSSSFDFDNDGDSDLYVANGFLSRGSAKDYCTHFWCHDIYMGGSAPDPKIVAMHAGVKAMTGEMSWNGYEHNCLLMNDSGTGFVNVAFLMDVAFEFDSRCVVSDDLNGDGRIDLLVYKFDLNRNNPHMIYALENRLVTGRHWIGVRLKEEAGCPVMGASVMVRSSAGEQIKKVVSGDSYFSQHAPMLHFGLGAQSKVDAIEVTWINGTRRILQHPQIDHYHTLNALAPNTIPGVSDTP